MPEISISLRKSRKLILGNTRLSLSLQLSELTEKGGTGIALFFIFLKYATIAFFFMSIATYFSMKVLYEGNGIEADGEIGVFQYEKHLARFSLGNLEIFTDINLNRQKTDIDTLIGVDFIIILIFIIFYIKFQKSSKKLKKQKKLLPSQYTLEVKGFPSSITNSYDIKQFFNDQGFTVSQVFLARNYKNTLFYHKQIIQIFRQMQEAKEIKRIKQLKGEKNKCQCLVDYFPNLFDRAIRLEKKYKKTQEKINDKVNRIMNTEKTLNHDSYQSIKAYVIFEKQRIKNDAFKVFKKIETNQYLLDCMPNLILKLKKIPKNQLFYERYSLKVEKKVDEPSDIRWENIEISNVSRFFRGILVFSLLIGFLALCLSLIILVNLYKPSYTLDLCSNTKWKKTQIKWNIIYPDIEDKECQEAFGLFFKSLFLSFLIGCFVLSINTMLKIIIKYFAIFMRYTSISQEVRASTMQIFRAQFINTGLLIALLNFDFNGTRIPEVLVYLVSTKVDSIQDQNGIQYVSDFTRGFYIDIGGKIVLTMMINIISPLLYALFGIRCVRCLQRRRAKKMKKQREMNRALIPPEFDIATGYAVALNTMFISLFYGAGIPILIPIGFVALFVQYWSLKYRILRFNKKPPAYDASLNKAVLSILPFAVFLHIIVGIFMFSQNDIVSNANQGQINENVYNLLKDQDTSQVEEQSSNFSDRFLHNYAYTAFGIVLLILYIFIMIFMKYWRKCKKCIKKNKQVSPETEQYYQWSYWHAYKEMEEHNIASYDLRDNRLYKKLVQAIDRGQIYDQQLQEELKAQQEAERLKEMQNENKEDNEDDDDEEDSEDDFRVNKKSKKNNDNKDLENTNNNTKAHILCSNNNLDTDNQISNNNNLNTDKKDNNNKNINIMEQSTSVVSQKQNMDFSNKRNNIKQFNIDSKDTNQGKSIAQLPTQPQNPKNVVIEKLKETKQAISNFGENKINKFNFNSNNKKFLQSPENKNNQSSNSKQDQSSIYQNSQFGEEQMSGYNIEENKFSDFGDIDKNN